MKVMPGFSAESSLYKSPIHFKHEAGLRDGFSSQVAIPQAWGCRNIGPCVLGRRLRCCVFPPGCKLVRC